MGKTSKAKLILLAILILASVLRLWGLDKVPVSLFGDELDVGYHAYSILKTGRDYSGNFLPLHFQSLAEWRTPLYLYSAVPTVALFGISPFGVRLPAALFGILGIWLFYLLVKEVTKNSTLSLLAALLLAISPWHIQYSRAGFEVTEMLTLYFAGLYFFFRGIKDGRWLIPAAFFLGLTTWVYSTAKLFVPATLAILFLLYRRELLSVPRKWLAWSALTLFLVAAPITYSTFFGGGAARFSYISVFSDPTVAPQIGFDRLRDAAMKGKELELGMRPEILDRVFHNKITAWTTILTRNYLQSFSTDFLFIRGDPNPRHSPPGIGEFYKIETIFLLLGLIFFVLSKHIDRKIKLFLIFWVLASPIPAALTSDGGNHATRLFFFLPPLVLLISYGIWRSFEFIKKDLRPVYLTGVGLIYFTSFLLYQHNFWVHYPWDSERWWHAGFKEAIQSIKQVEKDYDRVFISMAGEPAWIFFAGWYQYPPDKWHEGFPMKATFLEGFGGISYIDRFYFGSIDEEGATIYDLPKHITSRDLYLAVAKEIPENLVKDPSRVPPGLKLVKAISYPSGEPAFYLVSGSE